MNDQRRDLKAFIYLLMRDQVTSGKIETIMNEIRWCRRESKSVMVFSATHIANYADELAEELLKVPEQLELR